MAVREFTMRMLKAVLVAVLLTAAFTSLTTTTGAQQAPAKAKAAKKNPLLKLIEPWPTAEAMQKRREDSEALPLFASTEPLAFTLTADFKALNKDRNSESTRRYPGELRVAGADGAEVTLPVQLSARGHLRRMARTCDFVPIRVEFPKDGKGKTIFARQEALKLVVQCVKGGEYEQFILKEHLAYRLFNLITPQRSFRTRLARVNYIDKTTGQPAGTRHAMFLEDESDVAKRMEGRIVKLPRLMFKDVDSDTLMPMMLHNYMIGNTDFSIYALHNVVLVQRPDKSIHPVPYDFDISGLVHPPYAAPDRALMITSVRDRLYRGPCRPQPQVDPYIANFVAKKDQVLALAATIPGIDKDSVRNVKDYLEDFYSSIKGTKDVKKLFVDCKDKVTM
jgi:hypothetical protein